MTKVVAAAKNRENSRPWQFDESEAVAKLTATNAAATAPAAAEATRRRRFAAAGAGAAPRRPSTPPGAGARSSCGSMPASIPAKGQST